MRLQYGVVRNPFVPVDGYRAEVNVCVSGKGSMLRFTGRFERPEDPEQVEQALLNLLGNAVEATETGHVGLSAAVVDGEVEVIVEDSGTGIPVEYMERIFDLYFTTKQEGTGLGLSLVHRIVTEHGGRIEVQSLEGRGSRFTIRLPRLAEVRPGGAGSDLERARA